MVAADGLLKYCFLHRDDSYEKDMVSCKVNFTVQEARPPMLLRETEEASRLQFLIPLQWSDGLLHADVSILRRLTMVMEK